MSATETSPAGYTHRGDPYAYGGVAVASGGLKPVTNYGVGANRNSTGPLNPSLDRPEKGSGQADGELPVVAGPGYGRENGPALQASPSDQAAEGDIAHG